MQAFLGKSYVDGPLHTSRVKILVSEGSPQGIYDGLGSMCHPRSRALVDVLATVPAKVSSLPDVSERAL